MTAFACQRAGLIGKLPTLAEFLPPPASPPSFALLEAWLLGGMEWALGRAGPRFPEAFAAGVMYGFVFSDLGLPQSVLVGAIAPSHDSAGRQFPLTIAAPVSLAAAALARPELAPFLFEELWATSIDALSSGLVGDLVRAQASAATLDSTETPELEQAASLYSAWSAELPLSELWPLLGLTHDASLTLRFFLEAVSPLKEGGATHLSLRVPLGALGGVGLCFWLDVLRRSTRWERGVPSLFWTHDGRTGSALIHLGRPPKATVAELWLPTADRDDLADLMGTPSPSLAQHLRPLPHALAAALSGGGKVADLLHSLF